MKLQSLKVNMLLNAIKGLLGVLFPLISFPYISRILGVDNIGKYNFSNSIISFFILLSSLGIKTYAVREGAKIRDDKDKIFHFASQIFVINIVSTILSYMLFGFLLAVVPKFTGYRDLLFALSIQIVFTTLGVEWLYGIYEDYLYITILSIVSHIVSIVLLFVFVHTEDDLIKYALIVVFASVGTNVANYFHSKKLCSYNIEFTSEWRKHMKPILVFFVIQIATTVYINSDNTILGFMCDDHVVGIYAVSTKIYSVVKSILASVLVVSIPRLSKLIGNNDESAFVSVSKDIYFTLFTIMIPAIFGIIVLRKEIILLISSAEYLEACSSLFILCFALLFCLCAWFWGQCVLVPNNRESVVFRATLLSAITNIVLNLILIPCWKENAAAITTLISEALAFYIQWKEGQKYVHNAIEIKEILKVIIGCTVILFMGIYIPSVVDSDTIALIITIVLSVFIYFATQIILKNRSIHSIVKLIQDKIGLR